jgi:hypothetical protein
MKKTFGAIIALGILAVLPASAGAAPLKPAIGTETASAAVKVEWDYHGRWRSHSRYGSSGSGYSYGHYRWRSHRRYGSDGSGDGGGHSRWYSHKRYGSGGFGRGHKEHGRRHSHHRYGSESGFGY